jgi:hypothetical protein
VPSVEQTLIPSVLEGTELLNQHSLQVSIPSYEIPWDNSHWYVGEEMIEILTRNKRRAKVLLMWYISDEHPQRKGSMVL